MITPSFSPTATERVLPKLALDFTTASLDPRVTLTRALNTATCVNSSGNLAVVNADLPRFDYDPTTLVCKGLLIEESRVNSIRNNTMVGAAAGTPGTMPTNWSTYTPLTGLTREVVGTGTENGIAYIDIRLSGTPSAAGAYYVFFETNTGVTAATGQSWAISSYLKLASGSLTGITSFNLEMDELTSVGGFVKLNRGSNITPTTASLITQRNSYAVALSGGATTARVQPMIILVLTGAAIDVTFRIGLPQLELGAFATSVIQTSSGAVTRNADVATMTGTNFSSWFNATQGTLYVETEASANANTHYADISNGSAGSNNFYYDNSGGSIRNVTFFNSSATSVLSLGAVGTAGVVTKLCGAYKLDSFAASRDASNPATDTSGAVPVSVDRMDIGRAPNNAASTFLAGHMRKIMYWPQRLTNAEAQAFSK